MRLAVLALFICGGTMATGQQTAHAPAFPEQPSLTSHGMALPSGDFAKHPPQRHFNLVVPRSAIILPGSLRQPNDAQIDPKIIVLPPQSSIGEQTPGMQVAENLYPGLKFLPIDESKAKLEPIPTSWPNLKIENIPTVSPKLEVLPVQGATAGK
jgi:hypothetical protein